MKLLAWCTKPRDGRRCIINYILEPSQPHYLSVADLRIMFYVGRSKAHLTRDVLPSVRIGSKDYALNTKLEEYPKDYRSIHVN